MKLSQLRTSASLLADAGPSRRAKLPGISRHRAEQSLGSPDRTSPHGMEAYGATNVEIRSWSTRERLLLEHLGLPHSTADRPRLVG